jgi:hypothetical protein
MWSYNYAHIKFWFLDYSVIRRVIGLNFCILIYCHEINIHTKNCNQILPKSINQKILKNIQWSHNYEPHCTTRVRNYFSFNIVTIFFKTARAQK